jgi:hypothetical protein
MPGIHVRLEPEHAGHAEELDPYGLRALATLADLLPSHDLSVRYELRPGPITVRRRDSKLLIAQHRPLTHHPDWFRSTELRIDETAQRLFGIAAEDMLDGPLQFLFAICSDISDRWGDALGLRVPEEIGRSLLDRIPDWIVAHLAAEHIYSFESYGLRSNKHDELAATIVAAMTYMEHLASSRVENQLLTHGIVIAKYRGGARRSPARYPRDFQSLKRTPLLSDGFETLLWLSPNGSPVQLLSQNRLERLQGSRESRRQHATDRVGTWELAAQASAVLRGVSLLLLANGTLLVFADGRPLFMRRSGRWRGLVWIPLRDAMVRRFGPVGGAVFDAAVTVSASGHGCILGLVTSAPHGLLNKDRVDLARASRPGATREYAEWSIHALLATDQVLELGSRHLAQLAAIDGATIVQRKTGRLVAYGAVVPNKPGSSEGSRTAAARTLSEAAFVIKVSADGPMTVLERGRSLLEA